MRHCFGNYAGKALLFRRMTYGLRQWSCSTIWLSMHVINISITCRNLSMSEAPQMLDAFEVEGWWENWIQLSATILIAKKCVITDRVELASI
jgi:hypothetical protein